MSLPTETWRAPGLSEPRFLVCDMGGLLIMTKTVMTTMMMMWRRSSCRGNYGTGDGVCTRALQTVKCFIQRCRVVLPVKKVGVRLD